MGATMKLVDSSQPFAPHALHFVESFSLRNACVSFYNTSTASFRSQFISPFESAIVHGFSEHSFHYSRITTVRLQRADERELMAQRCVRRQLGLAVYFQSNNMFHAMFHAPPAWQQLQHHALAAKHRPTFIPLVGYIAGHSWTGDQSQRWRVAAWELLIRSLTAASSSEIAEDLNVLLSRCTCFDQVEGSTGYFSPGSRQVQTAPILRQWRARTLSNARTVAHSMALAHQGQKDITFVVRVAGTRVIANQVEVNAALASRSRVRTVVMEAMPLAEQILLVATTRVLVGVHGQALALMVFMSPSLATALLEIRPTWTGKMRASSTAWQVIYDDWCYTLGVHYLHMDAIVDTLQPLCRPIASRKTGGGPLRCNVTVPIPKLLQRIDDAAALAA